MPTSIGTIAGNVRITSSATASVASEGRAPAARRRTVRPITPVARAPASPAKLRARRSRAGDERRAVSAHALHEPLPARGQVVGDPRRWLCRRGYSRMMGNAEAFGVMRHTRRLQGIGVTFREIVSVRQDRSQRCRGPTGG